MMGIQMTQINLTRNILFFFLSTFLLINAGCGGTKIVNVKGNLKTKGKPLVVNSKTILTLQFIPKDGGNTFSGKIKFEDGSYEASFPSGIYNVLFMMYDTSRKLPIPKPIELRSNLDIKADTFMDLEIDS
jgi:hypothetical protein